MPDVGHEAGADVAVLVGEPAALTATDPLGQDGDGVELSDRPGADWWALVGPGAPTPAQRHVLDPDRTPPRTAFGLLRDGNGTAVGQVRAAVVADHLHLSRLKVVPAARCRGPATSLIAAAAAWAGPRCPLGGAPGALRDPAARALYDSLGCTAHHRVRLRRPVSAEQRWRRTP